MWVATSHAGWSQLEPAWIAQELSEVCGSPGEVANNPQIGHHFAFDHGVPDKHDWWLDTELGLHNRRVLLCSACVFLLHSDFLDSLMVLEFQVLQVPFAESCGMSRYHG